MFAGILLLVPDPQHAPATGTRQHHGPLPTQLNVWAAATAWLKSGDALLGCPWSSTNLDASRLAHSGCHASAAAPKHA